MYLRLGYSRIWFGLDHRAFVVMELVAGICGALGAADRCARLCFAHRLEFSAGDVARIAITAAFCCAWRIGGHWLDAMDRWRRITFGLGLLCHLHRMARA